MFKQDIKAKGSMKDLADLHASGGTLCLQCGVSARVEDELIHKADCPVLDGRPGSFSPPKVMNPSGLHPQGQAVLVEPYEPEINKTSLVIPDMAKERNSMVETRAVVIEIGPDAWSDEPRPRARPGEKVLISKFAGVIAIGVKDGKRYRLVNSRDIFCTLED